MRISDWSSDVCSSDLIALGQQGLFNFATYTVAGIDTQFTWGFGLEALGMSPSAGALEFSTTASYLRQYKVAGLLGSPTPNYAGRAGFGGVGGGIYIGKAAWRERVWWYW